MTAVKKAKGILLLDREKLEVYLPSQTQILSLSFPQTAIRNIDVIDRSALIASVHTFFTSNKIPPTSFTLILHDRVIFEKVFPLPSKKPVASSSPSTTPTPPATPASLPVSPAAAAPNKKVTEPTPVVTGLANPPQLSQTAELPEDLEKAIQRYIDSVPFDETIVTRVKTAEGNAVLVANKATISTLKEIFITEGSSIDMVLPWKVLPKEVNIANGLNLEVAKMLLLKVDPLRSHAFQFETVTGAQTGPVSLGMPDKASDMKRLYLMVGVFVILIIIMVVLFIRMNGENATLNKTPLPPAVTENLPVVTETPSPTIASTSATTKQALDIQISVAAGRASLSAVLIPQLEASGYTKVSRVTGGNSTRSIVAFSDQTPTDVQEEILHLVRSVAPNAAVEISTLSSPAIKISL